MINQDEIELIHAANKECDRLKEAIRLARDTAYQSTFYLRVAHEVWQFEANEMDDTDTNNLLAEYE